MANLYASTRKFTIDVSVSRDPTDPSRYSACASIKGRHHTPKWPGRHGPIECAAGRTPRHAAKAAVSLLMGRRTAKGRSSYFRGFKQERREHPWATAAQVRRIVVDHARKMRKRRRR